MSGMTASGRDAPYNMLQLGKTTLAKSGEENGADGIPPPVIFDIIGTVVSFWLFEFLENA